MMLGKWIILRICDEDLALLGLIDEAMKGLGSTIKVFDEVLLYRSRAAFEPGMRTIEGFGKLMKWRWLGLNRKREESFAALWC